MQYSSFISLKEDLERFEDLNEYKEALILLENGFMNLYENEREKYLPDYMIKKAKYYYMCKMYNEYINALTNMIDQGFSGWRWLFDIECLKHDQIYLVLKEKNDQLLNIAQEKTKLEYAVHLPEGYTEDKQYPLFLALHGGGGNMAEFSNDWKPDVLLKNDFIFVYVQSSQVSWQNGFNWIDPIIVRKDIKSCYNLVSQKYSINDDCILIGGFCGGAIATMDIVMANILPVKGFIAVSPDEKPESFTRENVIKALHSGVKGVFTEGELFMPVPDEEEMMKIFDETGFPYQFYINKGIGLSIPKDLSIKIKKALKYILN